MQSKVFQSQWIRYRAIGYIRGRGLSWGVGDDIYPRQATDLGRYSLNVDPVLDASNSAHIDICDDNVRIIARGSLDHVFVGNRISQFSDHRQQILTELVDKLKEGGHLVIHTVDESGRHDHAGWVEQLGYWQAKDEYLRDSQRLSIWKLLGKQRRGIKAPGPKPQKRACIARYGAIGDMVMITPLIRKLKEDGYHVTLNITPYCAEVLRGNPHVDNIILQERDAIPNSDLGHYWKEWIDDYDKYINLSESIEGSLIMVEGRRDFYTHKLWREETVGGVNYFDNTMKLGGYADARGLRPELYFTAAEEKTVNFIRRKFQDKFLILWALKGSSYHKIYPMLEPMLCQWLDRHPDAFAILAGSQLDAPLQFQHPQVQPTAGQIPIREVFALTKVVDLVAGPETGILNAASAFSTPKMVLLSHSSHENLCKYWENDYCLKPENVACYPCHQLHYSEASCPLIQVFEEGREDPAWSGPVCAGMGISMSRVHARLDDIYGAWKLARTPK